MFHRCSNSRLPLQSVQTSHCIWTGINISYNLSQSSESIAEQKLPTSWAQLGRTVWGAKLHPVLIWWSGKYPPSCSSWWLHGLLTASGIQDATTHLLVRCLFPSWPTAVLHFMAGLSLLQAPQWFRAQQRTDGCPFQFKMPLPNPQRWPNESCQRLWLWETFS